VSLAEVDPSLAMVDRWIERRAGAGSSLGAALESLASRFLARWSSSAPSSAVARVREVLRAEALPVLEAALVSAPAATAGAESESETAPLRAIELLTRMTGASGADAYEAVEQAFRRSLSRLGARFVARHARAAIDEHMGPMHATVVAADLFSMLERVDASYLEALTFALETMHDWGAVAASSEAPPQKTQPARARKARGLSSTKRRA
jgi:hypothetical protein